MQAPALRTQLIQTLIMPVTPTACQAIQPQLDDYVTAQLAGEPYATRFPLLALHLDACVACAEAYDLLYSSALAEARGVLPPIGSQPDLSFLKQHLTRSPAEQIRAAIERVGQQISLQFNHALAPMLRPAFTVSALRGATDSQRYHEKLIELLSDPSWQLEWPVTLVAYRDNLQPGYCLLEVTVQPEGWNWPDLEGILVTISLKGELRSAVTDAWGITNFEAVPTTWLTEMKLAVAL